MTPPEAQELTRLLKKLARQKFWIPNEAFEALHGTISMWAPELIITRESDTEILLIPCTTRGLDGKWHLPGGYNRWDESIQETCSRIAQRELGSRVTYRDVLGIYKWRAGEHPYGRPLSVYVRCNPVHPIKETKDLRFFNVHQLPRAIIASHARFIRKQFAI